MSKKWVCSSDSNHLFTSPTPDLFCDKCPPYSGVLMEVDDNAVPLNTSSVSSTSSEFEEEHARTDIGLYVFLVDSSGSMFEQDAFPNVAMSRAKLVSAQIAGAIFQMEDTTKKEDAYLFVLLFDHRLKPFINFMNVKQVFDKYKSAQELEEALFNDMQSLKGATDINLALSTAYNHANKFINGEMEVLGKIKPMCHSVFNPQTGDDKTIPNVRCLIFTDGEQYTGDSANNKIERNPFADFQYNGEYVNILMGAYHGQENDKGCSELKNIISSCHIHNEQQFFLFDNATQIGDMYKLFRMASGPSGFCPKCLKNLTISDKKK
jgi:hypothetical protein